MNRMLGSLTLAGWLVLFAQPGVLLAQGQPQAAGCAAALRDSGEGFHRMLVEQWTWDGGVQDVGTIGGAPVVLCLANGPLLPATNLIGCLLLGDQSVWVQAYVDAYGDQYPAGPACSAVRYVDQVSAEELLWIAHASKVTREVTRLRWNGSAFDVIANYEVCWDNMLEPLERSQRPECQGLSGVGTRENPFPVGASVDIGGDWT
jgi:hypothetical protein